MNMIRLRAVNVVGETNQHIIKVGVGGKAETDYNHVLQHQMKALLLSYSFIASRGSGLALVKTGQ